jgi:hypothetical protein
MLAHNSTPAFSIFHFSVIAMLMPYTSEVNSPRNEAVVGEPVPLMLRNGFGVNESLASFSACAN